MFLDNPDVRRKLEDRLAGPMFFLSVAFLVVLAAVTHRSKQEGVTELEVVLFCFGLAVLWPLFLLEGLLRFLTRDRGENPWRHLFSVALVSLVPPLRIGVKSSTRPNHLWLPGLGWRPVDRKLRETCERYFSLPMIFIALMVLPLLVIDIYFKEQLGSHPGLELFLAVGESVIWIAFTVEFLVMVSLADKKLQYCLRHWVDLAIVLLPLIEFLPLLRVLRLGRVARLEQVTRMSRLYRLRGLALKAWRAMVLLDLLQRLRGRHHERRLETLRSLAAEKERELEDLRAEIALLEAHLAQASEAEPPVVQSSP